ncbi:hypothetical protein ARMGADRAFT_1008777 [Armillaria gallica]|uniref:Uncharacterized protein n=1 Tax=Armillaria gallica TaxID=47427 RepID=A0A2H3EG31_ARMGA|nr:hypothetical protein ARMGADRAFT_1008777 [Armillaria gallica]
MIPSPSQRKATEAYDRSKLSAQPTLTGEVLTKPKVVDSATEARISLLVTCPSYIRLA